MTGPLTCFGANNGDPRVYYLGDTGNVHEAAWSSENVVWSFTNLTAKIHGAVPAVPQGALASFSSDGGTRVHFLDARAHVCQIAFEGGNWAFLDLTHLARPVNSSETVVLAAPGSRLACFGYQGKATRVQFVDAKGNVCQIGDENSNWIFRNLTRESGAPAAVQNSALTSFAVHGTDARVHFLDSAGHVIQILWKGSQWLHNNLTTSAAPTDVHQKPKLALSGSPLCGFAYAGNDTRVYFQDQSSHICEIADVGGHWKFTNATAEAKPTPNHGTPPLPSNTTDLACLAINGRDARVYYVDGASYIWELGHNSNGWVATAAQLQANSDASWAPAAKFYSSLACYLAYEAFPKVYYLRWQNDINELTKAGEWVNRTLVAPDIPGDPVSIGRLQGSSNYFLVSADSSKPLLTGISVSIDVTWPIALGSDSPASPGSQQVSGFSFQLNALSPNTKAAPGHENELTASQQYIMAMNGTTLSGSVNNWTAQPSGQGPGTGWTINSNGNPDTLHNFPTPNIPAGYRLTIALWNDAAGNVTSVSFVVMDTNSDFIANVTQQLSSIGGTQQVIAPIVAFTLNFVGPFSGESATLVTGTGMITCNAAQPLVAQAGAPINVAEDNAQTVETANTFYGALPQTGAGTGVSERMLAQPFNVGRKPQ